MGWGDLVLPEVVLSLKLEFGNGISCHVAFVLGVVGPWKRRNVIVELRQAGPMECSALIGLGEYVLCDFERLGRGESFDAGLLEGVS